MNPAKNQQNFRDAVPTFNPYYPAGAPSGLRINYNISAELQPTLAAAEMSGRWSAGLNLTLPSDWHGKLSYGYNLEENRALVSNVANLNNISAALGWTIPVTPASGTRPAIATWAKPANIPYLNVFCDPFAFQCNSPTTLNYISGYRDYDEHYGITEWNATFDGPLFSLPGGPVKAAVGADYQTHHFNFTVRQTYAPSSTLAAAMPEISVDPESRQNWAAFTEVNIPVIGEMNSLPLVHSLEVVGSFRYDHYSDFGGTRNPKVSVNWYPIEDLKLRGTWGTSFRAPAFSDSSAVGGVQIQPLNLAAGDSADVYPTCDTGQVLPTPGSAAEALAKALNPGSPTCASIPRFPGGLTVRGGAGGAALIRGGTTLEPEKATNWSGGFDYAPKGFFSGLDVSATYFWVKGGGLMQGLETSTGLGLRDPNTRSTFILPDNPNFANYVNALMSDPRSFVNPNFRTNILFINDGAIRNIGNLKVDGIDFNASYDWDWGQFGAWHAGIDGTYFLHRTQVSIPGTPAINFYDGNGIVCQFCNPASPDRFRYRVSLGWDSDPFMVNLFMNYQSHFYSNQAFPPASFLVNYPNYSDLQPNYITWDLSLGYNTGTKPANDYLQNVDFRFILSNLLDKKPPFMYKISSGGSNPAAFDINLSPVGRVMTFVITKTW